MSKKKDVIHTCIWEEEAEPDNPFAAKACYCAGYDVYGELLGKAGWCEYLYLLFCGEQPSKAQARLLEGLAVVLANPGPRDHSVRAAMNGGAGGSTSASCLIAALAVGAGQLGGAREVHSAIGYWTDCGQDLVKWQKKLTETEQEHRVDIWQSPEHPPGFDPHGTACANPIIQSLDYLSACSPGSALQWLKSNRLVLEEAAKCPLSLPGVVAATFMDLEFDASQGEMAYLLLRLPGAAVHALEQKKYGWRKYPFFNNALKLQDEADAVAPQEK